MPRGSFALACLASALLLWACGPRTGAPAQSGTSSAVEPASVPAPISAGPVALQITDGAAKPVSGDPEAGQQVFLVCTACHSLTPGQNMVGPSLHGLIGRKAGTAPGFQYSSANKASGLTWNEQQLYAYLENPQKTVPGTYMTYAGVKDPQKRADLIAFLAQATR
jgi:cytochrome c